MVDVEDIMVSVRHTAAVELSALLLTAQGRVRDAAGLVFYNQPLGPGVRLAAGSPGGPSPLEIALHMVPVGIDYVRVVIALDDQQDHLGDYPAPLVWIADSAGNVLYECVIEGLGGEATVVAVDLDRAETGGWSVLSATVTAVVSPLWSPPTA